MSDFDASSEAEQASGKEQKMSNNRDRIGMSRRDVLLTGTAFAAAGGLPATPLQSAQAQTTTTTQTTATDRPPNIVMLMTDDTGWNDFGC
jgi:hypothetical protein